jgi:hypothetical protein
MEKFEANFKPEIKLTEKEIGLLKKLMDAIQLYTESEDIKNPTEVLEPEHYGPSIKTETVGAPIEKEVYKYSLPTITFFIKKLIPEYPNIKEEQLKKEIEKVLEEMKDYLEKVGIGIDKKEELTNLIISLLKQVQQE